MASAIWDTRLRPFGIQLVDRKGHITVREFYAYSRDDARELARLWARGRGGYLSVVR